MTCRITGGGGVTIITCTRGSRSPRCKCGLAATKACDYPVTSHKSGTCDAPLCSRCAHNVGPDRDYCGPHYRLRK